MLYEVITIERILSNIAILHNMSPNTKYYLSYQLIIAFICYVKVANPEVFKLLKNKKSNPQEIFKKLELDKIPEDNLYSRITSYNVCYTKLLR